VGDRVHDAQTLLNTQHLRISSATNTSRRSRTYTYRAVVRESAACPPACLLTPDATDGLVDRARDFSVVTLIVDVGLWLDDRVVRGVMRGSWSDSGRTLPLVKAAICTRYGPPEVVRIMEVDKPQASENEVLVKIEATTVNRTDCGYRAAKPFILRLFTGLRKPKPRRQVLGTEFAGEIEAVGSGVTSLEVGDRVFGYIEGTFGAHAEYVTTREDASVATMPANATFAEAAASTEGSHYALANIRAAKISSNQNVLVNGATGAIGSAAVQLLKNLGAHVTAVCSTDHVALVGRLGADRVIDYRAVDFTTDDRTYDVVFDAAGKSSFGRCKQLLNPKGIYLSTELGPFPQNPILALITPLFGGKKVLFPIPKHDREMVRYIKGLVESGAFQPVIDREYPLAEIVEAYRYVETGQKIGNVVISVSRPAD
jgi:NADPH:quinone reductase-like Zn-dependent oxidoreductase